MALVSRDSRVGYSGASLGGFDLLRAYALYGLGVYSWVGSGYLSYCAPSDVVDESRGFLSYLGGLDLRL